MLFITLFFEILAVAADQRKLPARRNRDGVTVTRVTCPCVVLEDAIVGSFVVEVDNRLNIFIPGSLSLINVQTKCRLVL